MNIAHCLWFGLGRTVINILEKRVKINRSEFLTLVGCFGQDTRTAPEIIQNCFFLGTFLKCCTGITLDDTPFGVLSFYANKIKWDSSTMTPRKYVVIVMTNCTICNRSAGELVCVPSSNHHGTHSSYQTVVLSQEKSVYFSECHNTSSSQLYMLPGSTSALQRIYNLSKVYFVPRVYAKSETNEGKYQPITTTLFEHIGATHISPLSTPFTVPAISPSTISALPSSTPIVVEVSGNGTQSDIDVQNLNVQYPSTSKPFSEPMPFHHHIQREGEFICGWGAAFINIFITFPINKTMFRQQLHGISGLRAINQLIKDGPRYLYRGLLPPLLQKSSSLSVMFGMYYRSQDILHDKIPKLNIYMNHTLAALGAGTIEAIFTPFERVQALMQTREYHNKFSNTLDAFYNLRVYGLREYYRGISAIVMRNGPSNVAFFLGREYLQSHVPESSSYGQKVALDFISGACLGAVISTGFFPLNVVKVRMQCVLGGPFNSMWATFKLVVAERNGLSGLYRGIHLNYMRSFISWGIINASYEILMQTFFLNNS